MRSRMDHTSFHLFNGCISMNKIYRVMVEEFYAVFMKLISYGFDIAMKNGEIRQPVKAEMRTVENNGINIAII